MSTDNDSHSSHVSAGTLYLVATPIGNLDDISQRAIRVLSSVDMVAAEDTRHSQRLMSALNIHARMISCHDHNEDAAAGKIISSIKEGQSVALISDAGTPLVSDPGYRLVSRAHDESVPVVPVPGACAAIAALSACGLATDRFSFEGFPPAKKLARQHYFQDKQAYRQTMVFYESCHRIADTLEDMRAVLGDQRRVCFCREISKTFETIRRGHLGEICQWVQDDPDQRKGEMVIVVEGDSSERSDDTRVDKYLAVMLKSLPVKQAVALVAELTGENKNRVYKLALAIKAKHQEGGE